MQKDLEKTYYTLVARYRQIHMVNLLPFAESTSVLVVYRHFTYMFCKAERLVLALTVFFHRRDQLLQNLLRVNQSKSHTLSLKSQTTDTVVTQIVQCGNVPRYVHILFACAYQNKCLQEFLSRNTVTPNFYALANLIHL